MAENKKDVLSKYSPLDYVEHANLIFDWIRQNG